MKLVLATGIYPPDIGGPATYVRGLAEEMAKRGLEVWVVTYGSEDARRKARDTHFEVIRIPNRLPIIRWILYARALKKYGSDADAVIAFSSVSAGVPLLLARLKKPKKILRLGGDFLWERYTDRGGEMSLSQWSERASFSKRLMRRLLGTFDHIVFSTRFQEELYERSFARLPAHSVIENAFPSQSNMSQSARLMRTSGLKGTTLRLLFLGRFVKFKNVPCLLQAVFDLRGQNHPVTLTLVGDGPEETHYRSLIASLRLGDGVTIRGSVHGEEKQRLFAEHDLLVLPSFTEISPNTALEATASGLPVLLTAETGLSPALAAGMMLRKMRTREEIAAAIINAKKTYDELVGSLHGSMPKRSMEDIADAFQKIL